MDRFNSLLNHLKNNPEFINNIVFWKTEPINEGVYQPFPNWLSSTLVATLSEMGVKSLYSHQVEALNILKMKKNVVISTGTASGKSLCYQIPILNQILADGASSALLFFPTKALTYDQYQAFSDFSQKIGQNQESIICSIYDGDTPQHLRSNIRLKSNILLTNPDMMNLAILPHHTQWEHFFSQLKYIVIDEIHLYKGVFGSHIANLVRRMKRITEFYGVDPQFIMTSATIQNPNELAERLIEEEVISVDNDGSPKGEKNFIIFNPPIVNEELGLRESLSVSVPRISTAFMNNDVQTLVFCKTRKFVEILVRELRRVFANSTEKVRGYRSGYLKKDRREIEEGLKNRKIILAIATNALELGIDIGGVDAVILAGYPGSVSSLRQRIGRCGRQKQPSISIMVASMNPLDQYLANHCEYLLSRPLEKALIDPNNPLILLSHLKSAAFELPFDEDLRFGNLDKVTLREYLDYLCDEGVIQYKRNKYFWLSEKYPSNEFSLRSTITSNIMLEHDNGDEITTVGEVDYNSALWMVHPGAIYLQDGLEFFVKELDLEKGTALLLDHKEDYYTEPIITVEIEPISCSREEHKEFYTQKYGEIVVTSRVTGYKRIHNSTREILSMEELDLPENQLRTAGTWLRINQNCVEKMRSESMWLSDPNDYGKDWKNIREFVKKRDNHSCQSCGRVESDIPFHVHHKIPFKSFTNIEDANRFFNLITLCPDCHRRVEQTQRIRSALSGLTYLLANLSPLYILCDERDLGSFSDPKSPYEDNQPIVLLYDTIPAGIGLSNAIFDKLKDLLSNCRDVISQCPCVDGCPSCVGPSSENGFGGKKETNDLINLLIGEEK